MSKINILDTKPKLTDGVYDQFCCPTCYHSFNSYIANLDPKPVENFQKRTITIVCPECKTIIEYPFCPFQEAFPEKSPHNTSCARALGCCHPLHQICDSVCYETNEKFEEGGKPHWKEYVEKLVLNHIFRCMYKNGEKIAVYQFKSLEDYIYT